MERLTASRCKAIGDSLRRFDLTTANAITAHADWLKEAELALREACIQLAALPQTHTVLALRDRVDVLLDIVPRPRPVSQEDEE